MRNTQTSAGLELIPSAMDITEDDLPTTESNGRVAEEMRHRNNSGRQHVVADSFNGIHGTSM